MIKIFLNLAIILCFGTTYAQSNKIVVHIENINVLNGNLMIAIFDNEAEFKTKEKPVFADTLSIDKHSAETTFKNIPDGIYAVAVYHDENSDGKLNALKLGIPNEGIGFSGQIKSFLKAPKFNDCNFEITNDTTIVVSMHYRGSKSESTSPN